MFRFAFTFLLLFTHWLPDSVLFLQVRGMLIRPFLRSCDSNFGLSQNVILHDPSRIPIGRNVYMACGCWLLAAKRINIANEVMFGPYVVVSASDHTRFENACRFGPAECVPVSIGKGTWLDLTWENGISFNLERDV